MVVCVEGGWMPGWRAGVGGGGIGQPTQRSSPMTCIMQIVTTSLSLH